MATQRDLALAYSPGVAVPVQAIADDPSLVNSDPTGAGWFFKLKLDDAGSANDLMDETAYKAMIG